MGTTLALITVELGTLPPPTVPSSLRDPLTMVVTASYLSERPVEFNPVPPASVPSRRPNPRAGVPRLSLQRGIVDNEEPPSLNVMFEALPVDDPVKLLQQFYEETGGRGEAPQVRLATPYMSPYARLRFNQTMPWHRRHKNGRRNAGAQTQRNPHRVSPIPQVSPLSYVTLILNIFM